ncbi:hypothetical protein PIB30_059907 [Stylosanthes scabra]|uniref:Uncharacterized protein n=1 Tax=Stylosanthes scabra TaxID=79078 RepID=A0ABU6RKQ5_9FABA|nr:hypothetical protein [Stylosanthes scabra]
MGHNDRTGFFFWGMVHGSEPVDPSRRINRPSIGSIGLGSLSNRLVQLNHVDRRAFAGDGILTMIIESIKANGTWLLCTYEPKSTTFDSGEPYLGLILSNRQVREVNRRMSSWPALGTAGNLRLSPPSSYTTQDLFSPLPFFHETDCTLLPTTGCIPQFTDLFRFCWQCSSGALTFTSYAIATDGSGSGSGPGVPCAAYPMCDARRYRSLFPRHRVAPPTLPPPSPPPSEEEPSAETYDPATELVGDPDEPYVAENCEYDTAPSSHHSSDRVTPPTPPPPSPPPSEEEPFAETYDPATELVGDPDEPYVAEHVPYEAPGAYYSDASYGSERESASTDTAPSSHRSSGSVSLGYGSASSGSTSDGASDDDLVNRYFVGTFPPPSGGRCLRVVVIVPHELLAQYED